MNQDDELARMKHENMLLEEAMSAAEDANTDLVSELVETWEALRILRGQVRNVAEARRQGKDIGPLLDEITEPLKREGTAY